MFLMRLRQTLYGFKQSGRMWYNRLNEYLIIMGYLNNGICLYVSIKKSTSRYTITTVYIDDINPIGMFKELFRTTKILKKVFEMKELGKIRYCLLLQIEQRKDRILHHQEHDT